MIVQGKTVEEAVEAGLKELGIAREDAEIKVLEQGKKGILGIGAVPAKVEICAVRKLTDGERAVAFLAGLFPLLGSEAKPGLVEEGEKIVIDLEGADKGVIGRRGEVIDAVQTLAGAVANTGRKEYKRVVVDSGNYREQREETLKRVAEKLAAKAVRLGKRVRLEPMNPYERRIIHSALVDNPDVTTKSEGKEPARYVVITPKNQRTDKRGTRYGGRDRGAEGRDRKDRGDRPFKGRDRGGRNGKYGERKPYPKRELPDEATPETSGTSFSRGATPAYKKGGFSGFFGTYLGKADDETLAEKPTVTENEAPMSETEPAETPATNGTAFKPEE